MGTAYARDEELVSRIKAGDTGSLDKLVEVYLPMTYKKVRRLVPIDDAEDVTQDIFMNLVRCIENFEGKSGFATWFNSIILNRVADYHRKMFRYKNKFIPEKDVQDYDKFHEIEANNDSNAIEMEDILLKLPEPYREVLLLKLHHDMSFVEIASTLGIDYEAVRSRYRRGIKCAARKIQPRVLTDQQKSLVKFFS